MLFDSYRVLCAIGVLTFVFVFLNKVNSYEFCLSLTHYSLGGLDIIYEFLWFYAYLS